jgi:ubiquinone/menaquinone biosynthesis C-methylase UbiE
MSHRAFLPAAGHDVFLPLYDPIVSLMGFDSARRGLISGANIEPRHRVLDIGCGTGTLMVKLKQEYRVAQAVGLDPDPKALRRARIKAAGAAVSVQFDRGFANELPYTHESFDRVFSSFMFHHLNKQERENMLREVLRVLKPGGSFHLVDFIADDASHGSFDQLFRSHAQMKDNSDERIRDLMSSAGFRTPVKVKEGNILFGLLHTAYYQAVPGPGVNIAEDGKT